MASFKADNIETDDESDDEPDDTKEIQIEEALKVYQTAVKLQSQGLAFLKETGEAYKTLFESDVFSYPESWSEYRRVEVYGEQLYDEGTWYREQNLQPVAQATGVENAPSTLPQVLHLSYKNRALHYLDVVRASIASDTAPEDARKEVSKALDDFTEALDKDEDDVDLWRRAAKISAILKSHRISRYCLETVVEGDEQGTDETLGDSGMEVKLADHDLHQLTKDLDDDVWKDRTPPKPSGLPLMLRKQLSLYSYLPEVPNHSLSSLEDHVNVRAEHSWTALGVAIHQRLLGEQQGLTNSKPGVSWRITIPGKNMDNQEESISPHQGDIPATQEQAYDKDTGLQTEPNSAGSEEPIQIDQNPEPTSGEQVENKQPLTIELPTRKRSSETAELPEEAEGGRVRSKRIRARESNAGEAQQSESSLTGAASGLEEKILESVEADQNLHNVLQTIVERIGVNSFGPAKPYRDLVTLSNPSSSADESTQDLRLSTALGDFYNSMQNWTMAKTKSLLRPSSFRDTDADISADARADAHHAGLSVFLEHSNTNKQKPLTEDYDLGLGTFVERVNNSSMCTADVAFDWICSLLYRQSSEHSFTSSYLCDVWPVSLKDIFTKIVVAMDTLISIRFRELIDTTNSCAMAEDKRCNIADENLVGMLSQISQSLFEIHLDNFILDTNPDAKIKLVEDERLQQRVRLNKWSALARDAASLNLDDRYWHASKVDTLRIPKLQLRHLWASVHQLKILEEVERDHLLLCIEDLKKELYLTPDLAMELPNSSAMPDLSIAAADAEISKLETMDFFLGIYQKEGKTEVDLIESLEPLLEQSLHSAANEELANGEDDNKDEDPRHAKSTVQVLTKFLAKASIPLRLSLWRRLLESYEAIDYPPKVFSIHLRCIQVIVEELNESYVRKTPNEREEILLGCLPDLRELLQGALELSDTDASNIFECLDIDHLRISVQAATDLWILLYAVALFDDYSQAGGKGGPSVNPFRTYPSGSFHHAAIQLHDMQIQTSVLLYRLIKEAMSQMPEEFPDANEVKLQYLRHMHHQFGVRKICKAKDGLFLRFMQDELMNSSKLDPQSSIDLAQILYDLYDLNCFSTSSDRQEHGCDADYLDRKTAMGLIDFVMEKARQSTVKDLLKSDLGKSMEKLHSTLGMVKSNFAALRNRKFYDAYLSSPIQPLELIRSLEGIADVSTVPVSPEEGLIASKGWYLLKGQISLAKYRAQRAKSMPGEKDDLNNAVAFFMQDLEFDSERWETWYRLAQAHEGLLEEQILWSAEKMNNSQTELARLQRSTIHTYVMATAVANRTAEPSEETATKLSELYTDFAVCIYSATRQPFAMRAYSLQDFPQKRFSNADIEGGQYEGKQFSILTRTQAYKFAVTLLKKAASYAPNRWVIQYMLGKCLWKLHARSDQPAIFRRRVQNALLRAIEMLPARKDPNRQEPIMEPIYKLVSITHKLVQRQELTPEDGSKLIEEVLLKQKQLDVSKRPNFEESQSWASYIIAVLKLLRAADKVRWHHRMVVRAAHLIHEQPVDAGGGAQAAKDYLLEQHIYSNKTYALNIWKPEQERPGRHWIYTEQYARFLTCLFAESNDVEGIQGLAKRVRKKPNDFFNHVSLWEYICEEHVKIHREYGHVRYEAADAIFKHLDQEEFGKRADLIDKWISSALNTHRLYNVIREAIELKKLNAALIKPTVLDDLLADTYAEIWVEFGNSIMETTKDEAQPTIAATAPTISEIPGSPPKDERPNRMALTHLMNLDGNADNRSSKAGTPTPSQPDQAIGKSRSRLISKREIIKRANDAIIINKSTTKIATSPPPKTAPSNSDTTHSKAVIDGPGGADVETEKDGDVEDQVEADIEGDDAANAESPRGSLHDSADDESELSEVDLEEEEEEEGEGDEEEEEEEPGSDGNESETSPVVVRPRFTDLRPRSPGRESSASRDDQAEDQADNEDGKGQSEDPGEDNANDAATGDEMNVD